MTDTSLTPPQGPANAVPPGPPPYVPPSVPPAPETLPAKRAGMGVWIALFAVLALIIGAGIGYAAAMPSKNDITKQRDAAQAQASQLQASLSQNEADELNATNAKDKCSKAATDASDLVKQWENVMTDIDNYMASSIGSTTEAELAAHIDEQFQTMDAQKDIVTSELTACQIATSG